MKFDELLAGLGKTLGVELPNGDGSCTLGVDDMTVTMQYLDTSDLLCTYAEIGEPPPEGLEQLLSAMLNANHLFQGTDGATISRDPDTGKFFLCRCDALELLNVEDCAKMLERFVNVLETWRKLLADYRPMVDEHQLESEIEPPPFGGNGFMTV